MFIRFLYQVSDLHIQAEAETGDGEADSRLVVVAIGCVNAAEVVVATPTSTRVSKTAIRVTRVFCSPLL